MPETTEPKPDKLTTLRRLIDANIAEIRAFDSLRRKARLEYGVMLGSIVLVWSAGVYAHAYTPYLPAILPLHAVAAFLFAENLFLNFLSKTPRFSRTVYFGTFIVEQSLIFSLVYATGGSSSPLFVIPILYFLGTFFIHGLIQGFTVFVITMLGYVLPAILGFQEFGIVLQATLFMMVLLPVIFVPIGLAISAERQKTLAALRDSEKRYRDLANLLPQTVFELDGSGKLTFANKAGLDMFGLTKEDLLDGITVFRVIAPHDRERLEENMRQALRDLQPKSHEYTAVRKDGSFFPIIAFSSAVIRDDRPAGLRGIVIDITERKQAEEEIRKLNEELESKVRERTGQLMKAQEELVRKEKLAILGQLAGSVGHELRNPLGVINNAVFFLKTVLADADDVVKEYLAIIKDEITGSERIVSDLLDSVRTKPPHPTDVGARELVQTSLAKCGIPQNVSVELDIPDTVPPVKIDPFQMSQVLINLIKNAVDAMPYGGELRISASVDPDGRAVRLFVADTGVGMTSELKEKLFQPLFTTKTRGIGLGLIVVKNLTESNGGEVAVESEPGKGTVFIIRMPAGRVLQWETT